MTDTDRLASIRARADAATPGPWLIDAIETGEHALFIDSDRDPAEAGLGTGGYMVASWLTESNAEFIAASRTDIAFLLDQLAAAEAKIAQAPHDTDCWVDQSHPADMAWGRGLPWNGSCTCWKSGSPVSAVDAVRAEAPQPFTCEWPDHNWKPLDDGSRDTSRCVRCGMRKH